MKTFKEHLEIVEKNGLRVNRIFVAAEVNYLLQEQEQIIDDENFEAACELVYEAYMKCEDMSVTSFVYALKELYEEKFLEDITIDELIDKADATRF